MSFKSIQNSIIKYLTNSANVNELDKLEQWLDDSTNENNFKEFVKTKYAIIVSMNNPDYSEIKKRLQKEIRAEKKIYYRKSFRTILKYAAIGILFVSIGYFLKNLNRTSQIEQPLVANDSRVTLELDNGEIIVLEEKNTEKTVKLGNTFIGVQNKKRLSYISNSVVSNDKVRYNTINVPYGKQFDVILSDGTLVYLNSGSKLKYPVNFLDKKRRKVILEGEAFFEVFHDIKRPFIVETVELDVEVLGTKFNISNYQEDASTSVVLTNGSVNLNNKNKSVPEKKVTLKPGMLGLLDKTNKSISTEKVNTQIYTSWLDNNLVFRNASFDEITKKLERKYNIIIINNSKSLLNQTFNATIECDKENIIQVFEYFKIIHNIEYRVYENKIIID